MPAGKRRSASSTFRTQDRFCRLRCPAASRSPRRRAGPASLMQATYLSGETTTLSVIADVERPVQAAGIRWTGTSGRTRASSWSVASPQRTTRVTGSATRTSTLPPREAGTYAFEGRYLGSASYLPSSSDVTELVIEPALKPGEVVINGGDAITDTPYVTVAAPAVEANAQWISTNPETLTSSTRSSISPHSPWSLPRRVTTTMGTGRSSQVGRSVEPLERPPFGHHHPEPGTRDGTRGDRGWRRDHDQGRGCGLSSRR